jgi:hypothetical protein
VVALLVLGFGSWFWPQIAVDRRFVGVWKWDSATLHLNSDSTGSVTVETAGKKVELPSRWWTKGKLLHVDAWPRQGLDGLTYRAKTAYQRVRGMPDPDRRLLTFYIVEVSDDRLIYRGVTHDGRTPIGVNRDLLRVAE